MCVHICIQCGASAMADTVCEADGAQVVEDRTGEIIGARYRMCAPLGQGGMGSVVWTAEQLGTGRAVALKLLTDQDPAAQLRFERGAIIASHLNHPGIATVHDQGRHADGSLFLVMERLEGHDLRAALADGPLASERVAQLMDQLLGALVYMHDKQVMHLDIKPANLFVARCGDDEYLKLLDFDITDVTADAAPRLRAPLPALDPAEMCGTPQYMAPESLRGDAVDTRADLYAVGVVMYELLTGLLPFPGPDLRALQHQHQAGPPRTSPLRAVPARLAAVVMRALRRQPRIRFEDARAMRRALRDSQRNTEPIARIVPERIAPPSQGPRGYATQPGRSTSRPLTP